MISCRYPAQKRRSYLEENVAAVDIMLTPEELRRINKAVPEGAAAGDRHDELSSVNR